MSMSVFGLELLRRQFQIPQSQPYLINRKLFIIKDLMSTHALRPSGISVVSGKHLETQTNQYLDIITNGFPICLAIIAEMIIITINISYLSDESAKAGLGLSGVLMHSFGGSFIYGFNYGFATFASRTYGAKNLPKFKLYVVQGFINLLGLLLVLVFISLFSYRIMIFAGQEQTVSVYTSQFLIYVLPGFITFYLAHFIKSTLQAQQIIRPSMLIDGIAVIFHIAITTILSNFIQESKLVILTTNLTFFLSLILTLAVQRKFSIWKLDLSYFSIADKFQDYKYFIKQCSYIALPVSLDMFVFEFMLLYIGYFHNTPETTAHVIIVNVFVMIGSIYIGFTSYMGTKIGNHVGRNEPEKVKEILWKVMKLVLIIIYSCYLVLYFFQTQIISFYSDDPKVAYYIKPVIDLFSIFFLVDGVQFSLSVYFKSIGYGSWVIKMFALCFYAIGLSSMLILTTVLQTKIVSAWGGNLMGSVALTYLYYKKWLEIDIVAITAQLHAKVNVEQLANPLLIPLSDLKTPNP